MSKETEQPSPMWWYEPPSLVLFWGGGLLYAGISEGARSGPQCGGMSHRPLCFGGGLLYAGISEGARSRPCCSGMSHRLLCFGGGLLYAGISEGARSGLHCGGMSRKLSPALAKLVVYLPPQRLLSKQGCILLFCCARGASIPNASSNLLVLEGSIPNASKPSKQVAFYCFFSRFHLSQQAAVGKISKARRSASSFFSFIWLERANLLFPISFKFKNPINTQT